MSRILIVDDETKLRTLLSMALSSEKFEVEDAQSAEQALEKLKKAPGFDVVITDIRMPGLSGLELIQMIKGHYGQPECIVMTAYGDAGTGVEAMRLGAFEYVLKPFEMDEMVILVRSALERRRLRLEVEDLKLRESGRYQLDSLIGAAKPMQELMRQAKMVAKRDTTVLIRGRSGTGKELIARGIHTESGRDAFITVNCGAVPENLLESELFGHEKGAFTGAIGQKIGYFERAQDGTIFLDEIGDITPAMQVKLLRVLQEREFIRVGGTKNQHTNARVLAATHRNLEEEVKKGNFREDLYFRLNVFPLYVPSLSERMDDLPALVGHFLRKFGHSGKLADGVLSRMLEYAWPGNVRELENCLERAAIIAGPGPLELDHLPEQIRQKKVLEKPSVFQLPSSGISLDELEKSCILQALDMTHGNKTRAAMLLGITRRALYSKMHTHSIRGYGATGENAADTPEAAEKG
jgi:DNA-binding NtrC family response regulator